MPYQLPDGRLVSPDRAFTLYDIQYPAGWLRNSTAQDRAELGIVWVNPGPTWDQRFYWGYDQDGQLIPKDHGQLVTLWTSNTRNTANAMLTPTDWMVVRQADNGTVMNQDWKDWREAVRVAAADKVQQIEATVRTSDLAEYVTSSAYSTWPNDPDHPPIAADDPASDGMESSGDGV
jgi:hypothetical protein